MRSDQPHISKKETFQVDPIYHSHNLVQQSREVNGRFTQAEIVHETKGKPLKQGVHKFHNPLYKELLLNVVPLRKEYRKIKDLDGRKEMAKREFDLWNGYLEARKAEIDGLEAERLAIEEGVEVKEAHRKVRVHYSHKIKSNDMHIIKEWFDRYKSRKTHKLPADKLTDLFGEYSKMFKVKIPLHPKNLSQLVHPFHGYLASFRNKEFDFDELINIIENQAASSYEKEFGRELLGDELSCLSFWLIQDETKKGWLSLEEFKGLLFAFKFDYLFYDDITGKLDDELTLAKLTKEFKFNLQNKSGEFLRPPSDSAEYNELDKHIIVRFDFARDIFLERGL